MGSRLVERLTARGEQVRVLSRKPPRSAPRGVEMVLGDLRESESVARAVTGVRTVVAAAHGFDGRGGVSPQTIDGQGNLTLIRAAESAGVEHLILLSVVGVAADHPMDLFQMKARAEAALRSSTLGWTIIRATAFMETWMMVIGEPLIGTGKTRIFGSGRNPVNFVSTADVAEAVEAAVFDSSLRQTVVEVSGPEDLSWTDFIRIVQEGTNRSGKVVRVPLPMLRVMSVVMAPVNPTMARQVKAAVVMDTRDMTLKGRADPSAVQRVGGLRLADVVRRDYAEVSSADPVVGKR